jgi:glycosyltransferase involved in cell wall biosynthesis
MQKNPAIYDVTTATHRVLQSCLSRSWGGLEMVAFENAVSMSNNRYECTTLCFAGSPLEKHLHIQGLPTLSLSQRSLFDFLKVRQFIQQHQIKTILVQHLKDLRLLSLATLNQSDMKMVAISHTLVNVNKKDFIHRWSYKKLEKVVCLTIAHKQNLLQHLPLSERQLEVIPNFVDCEHFNPRNRSEEIRKTLGAKPGIPLVGIASRLDPQKGQDTALEAMAILKKKNIALQLVIIGENTLNEMNYLEILKQRTQELGLEDRIHFAGYRGDMEKVMASLDALVMPSHCETFGRVLIEAMASKTPVIATRAGGVPEIIDSDRLGLLVRPQNPDELASAMLQIATKPELRYLLSESGYFKVRSTYAKDVVESKLLSLLAV